MDWSDSSLNFACERLSVAVENFTGEATKLIKDRALALLNDLRSCRVTLDYLHNVDAVEFISGKKTGPAHGDGRTKSVSKALDDSTAKQVKDYLVRRIQDYRKKVCKEYEEVVPREREAFEKGFDSFVDICLTEGVSKKRTWFEHQVRSGAGQPHLWKVWVVFQNQLRDACEAKTKEPLPPPLFSTVNDTPEHVERHFSHHHRGGFGRPQGGAFSDSRNGGRNNGQRAQQQYRPHYGQHQARGCNVINANAFSTGRPRQFCGGRKNGFYDSFQPHQYHKRGNPGHFCGRYPSKGQGGTVCGHGNLGNIMTKRPGLLQHHNCAGSRFQGKSHFSPHFGHSGEENGFGKPQPTGRTPEKLQDGKGVQVAIIAPDGKFKTVECADSA